MPCARHCRTQPAAVPPVQRKARLGAVNDPAEREADRAADRVLAGHSAGIASPSAIPSATVRRKAAAADRGSGAEAAAGALARQTGAPLSASERAYFEPRFGRDLSAVRLHTGGAAARAADRIVARAYTVGQDIGFASGEYRPETVAGRRLLAHELAHTLQQQAEGTVRRDPKPAVADPELEVGTRLREPSYSAGYDLAFYDQDEPEAQRRAADFAGRERAIGIKDAKFTAGSLVFGKAISGANAIKETVPKIAGLVNAALAKVPAAPGLPAETAAAPGKIRALAVFAHGTESWCSLSVTSSNAPGIFKTIAPYLSSTVRIILYTCSSAKGPTENLGETEYEKWRKGTFESGGKTSMAAIVRDALVDAKVENAHVWGHTTVGHTSRNFALREFEGNAGKGKGTEGHSFAGHYVFDSAMRKETVDAIVAAIGARGYVVDPTAKAFGSAVASVVSDAFYAAYAEANRKLTGNNPAEEAPLYTYETAQRILEYWKDTYWPREMAEAVSNVIKAARLKKAPPPSAKP
ncbi:DUF4157 domain-containing protein [Sinorhizobium sp. BG8]|nr:DUF4157 domain-containing protein [Sinorhizobium sp. BG8]